MFVDLSGRPLAWIDIPVCVRTISMQRIVRTISVSVLIAEVLFYIKLPLPPTERYRGRKFCAREKQLKLVDVFCHHIFLLFSPTCPPGVSGFVRLDPNGDRVGDYSVWHLPLTGEAKYTLPLQSEEDATRSSLQRGPR